METLEELSRKMDVVVHEQLSKSVVLATCAHCGLFCWTIQEPDGTEVCNDCFWERNGFKRASEL